MGDGRPSNSKNFYHHLCRTFKATASSPLKTRIMHGSTLLLFLASSTTFAFLVDHVAPFSRKHPSRPGDVTLLGSTLTPHQQEDRAPHHDENNNHIINDKAILQPVPAIAMTLDELSVALKGRGRAQLAWDCYANGLDPALVFSTTSTSNNGNDDDLDKSFIPSRRRGQSLGADALELLQATYQDYATKQLQDGVATLSHVTHCAKDRTTKLLLKLQRDGLEIETVILPRITSGPDDSTSLCISSQVGCAQACTFCATGRMGRLRSLHVEEILVQVFYAIQQCRQYNLPEISNIVFMGMGEAADNAAAVRKAVQILTTRELFQLSNKKVTISTVAPTPDSFRELGPNGVLAWSVHAADDALRKKLVPTTRYRMTELRAGLIESLNRRPISLRTCMLEIALIANVNDQIEHAEEMAKFVQVIADQVPNCKLIVNLIPFNDIGHVSYEKPSEEQVVAFQRHLWSHGIHTHIRKTRGDDESAACGQLATKRKAQLNQQSRP